MSHPAFLLGLPVSPAPLVQTLGEQIPGGKWPGGCPLSTLLWTPEGERGSEGPGEECWRPHCSNQDKQERAKKRPLWNTVFNGFSQGALAVGTSELGGLWGTYHNPMTVSSFFLKGFY